MASARDRDTNAIKTGMKNLDAKFQREGLLEGSVVSIKGKPTSLSDIVAYNFLNGRKTIYATFGESTKTTHQAMKRAGGIGDSELTTLEFSTSTSPEAFSNRIRQQEKTEKMTILVDPINHLEQSSSEAELTEALNVLKKIAEKTNSLCVLRVVETGTNPANRWLTLTSSDTVFSVLHETSRESVDDGFAIEKTHPLQSLRDQRTRVFQLKPELNIDISTKQTMSP
jgi:archaellum biogenesis ATPase FlaH